jgi:two-component sensor histidine kinase
VISVSDGGIELPTEVVPDDPSSLGLTLVRLRVQQLQGTLQVDNGRGTTISVVFPALV